jgi:threonine aldolase
MALPLLLRPARAACRRRHTTATATVPSSPQRWSRRAVSTVCFQSDNCRGAMPEILEAVIAANDHSAVPSYGADDLTTRAADTVRGFLGCHPEAAVVPTISGIASDALGLTPYAHPTNAVYVHEVSHLNLWQCGALGFYTVSTSRPRATIGFH